MAAGAAFFAVHGDLVRAKIQQWLYAIHGSYWFVPAIMATLAITLSQAMVFVDRQLSPGWMNDQWWSGLNQPEGARTLLATVAGSMITVAGVTFSLTILAVSHATSHYGPRLVDNFMRDRGNQVTLGTFLATFLFCLLVLRTVRSGADSVDASFTPQIFVPHLSVLVGVVLTLCSVGVLIYFIHHVPESINIAHVLDRIATELSDKIREIYPETLGAPAYQPPPNLIADVAAGVRVYCEQPGYLQGIDETALLKFARHRDAIVLLLMQPGDFLLQGQQLAAVKVGAHPDPDDSQDCTSHVLGSLAVGIARTPTQDIRFLINQLVEIAIRALSPGVNDPRTAIQCIDRLAQALCEVSQRTLPSRFRQDQAGHLRIIAAALTWDQFVQTALVQLVPYAKQDPNVSSHLRRRIGQVIEISEHAELSRLLRQIVAELDPAP